MKYCYIDVFFALTEHFKAYHVIAEIKQVISEYFAAKSMKKKSRNPNKSHETKIQETKC
jgi:hypothetical protein